MGKVLVDTCVWVDFLTRSRSSAAQSLADLLDDDAVCLTGVVLAELLHGCPTDREADRLLSTLQPLEFLETPYQAWLTAGRYAAELRHRGLTLPLSDLIVAAVAELHERPILTTDTHFHRIPRVKLHLA